MLHQFALIYGVLLLLGAVWLQSAWISWLSLQLAVLPLCFETSQIGEKKYSFRNGLPLGLSSLFLAYGFWIGLPSEVKLIHQIGIVLICVGVGGLTGWFPLSAKVRFEADTKFVLNFLSFSLIPVCLGAIFFYRSVISFTWSEDDLAILAVVSLFSLAMSGIRLMGPLAIRQRIQISILTILGSANIAIILTGWEKLSPERTWGSTTNLPTGEILFIAILLIEATAIGFLLICTGRILEGEDSGLTESNFVQKLNSSHWLRRLFLLGNLSLAGFPLFPGSLWRFALMAALILPYQQSNVTQLAEPHDAFIYLAIAFMLTTIITSVGHVRIFQLVVEEQTLQKETARPEIALSE